MPTDNDLLSLTVDRTGDLTEYWNFFIVVASAIVAIIASGSGFVGTRAIKAAISLLFVLFAGSNLWAIHSLNQQRAALLDLIDDPALQVVVARFRPEAPWLYGGLHIALDIAVLMAIWVVRWPSAKSEEERSGGVHPA
jgi:hypothetical protein